MDLSFQATGIMSMKHKSSQEMEWINRKILFFDLKMKVLTLTIDWNFKENQPLFSGIMVDCLFVCLLFVWEFVCLFVFLFVCYIY